MYRRFLHIALLGLLCVAVLPVLGQRVTRGGSPLKKFRARGEDQDCRLVQCELPTVCYGTIESYGVGGNANSTYVWEVYTITEDGRRLSITPRSYHKDNRQEVEIHWVTDEGEEVSGLFTFSVVETLAESEGGCVGEPYEWDVMVHSDKFILPNMQEKIFYCEGDTCAINAAELKRYADFDFFYMGYGPEKHSGEFAAYRVPADQDGSAQKIRLVSQDGACAYGEITAEELPTPKIDLGPDTMIMGNQFRELTVGSEYVTYDWNTDNQEARWLSQVNSGTTHIKVYGADGTQQIWLTVTDQHGCQGRDTITISVLGLEGLRIPAAFTPNGDGVNDTWVLPAPFHGQYNIQDEVEITDVRIYDRTGTLVWSRRTNYVPWDGRDKYGRELPMDSYHYEMRVSVPGDSRIIRGSVTIVR